MSQWSSPVKWKWFGEWKKKCQTVCNPARRFNPGVVLANRQRNNCLCLNDVDKSIIPIQWPFSELQILLVPLFRSPTAGLVYSYSDKLQHMLITLFKASDLSLICLCECWMIPPYNIGNLLMFCYHHWAPNLCVCLSLCFEAAFPTDYF